MSDEKARIVPYQGEEKPDEELQRLRSYYAGRRLGFMSGENPELLRLCIAIGGVWVGFTFAFNKRECYARPVLFNSVTGRVFVVGGSKNSEWSDNFLLKQVKKFRFPAEVFEEWQKSKRR